ncbi:MAG: M20/M25/M40 family metallo-hydrolase [Deltaproteobacteria bacterium]|nr:M20/M25/M40 family metallo-hydrolase [Deltaproteobacteria bacterium]
MALADPVELLAELVRRPSITGDTRQVQRAATGWLRGFGVRAQNGTDGVTARIGRDGPALLFISHLDTVPPGEGWTVDPFGAQVRGGKLYGRGATDAKGSAAAMCAAFAELAADPKFHGHALLYLSSNEEGDVPSAIAAIPRLGPIGAAVVGEPTMCNVGVAQRGLLVLELRAMSEQVHAAHGREPSSALLLARDLARVCELEFPKVDPDLGGVRITPTRLAAGVADNVVPPSATAMLDVRTVPTYTHDEIKRRIQDACKHCRVSQIGTDWPSVRTPAGHRLLDLALRATGGETSVGAGASDWAFLGDVPAVKIGAGDTHISHRSDEHVAIAQVRKAAKIYTKLAKSYFAPARAAS